MIWRTVTDLPSAEWFGSELLEWRRIGSDSYSVLYDAGNIMVGFWEQEKLLRCARSSRTTLVRTSLSGDRACGQLSLSPYLLTANPASELQFTCADLLRLSSEFGWPAPAEWGKPFVDRNGNFYSVAQAESLRHDVIGYTLMVSDIRESEHFYGRVLGLETEGDHVFSCGTITIRLRHETAIGLLASLNRMQRLMGDWVVFHVTDIETMAARLESRGVRFPCGIEDSRSGRIAYFNDPNGHSLNLWEPPDEPADINYFPVLTRLVNRSRGAHGVVIRL
jgi:predicted enzyme related to lactoylglutathione lyase